MEQRRVINREIVRGERDDNVLIEGKCMDVCFLEKRYD